MCVACRILRSWKVSSMLQCPGKQFAYQEMRLVLATLLRRYEMKEAPGFDSQVFEDSFVCALFLVFGAG